MKSIDFMTNFKSGFKNEVYELLGPVCRQTIANLKSVLGRTLNCKLTLANCYGFVEYLHVQYSNRSIN